MNEPSLIDHLIESIQADLGHEYDIDRCAFRAILRWAIKNKRLIRRGDFRANKAHSDDCVTWEYGEREKAFQRTADVSGAVIALRHRYGADIHSRILRLRNRWYFTFRQGQVVTPWQFLKHVLEYEFQEERLSQLLFDEFEATRAAAPRKLIALACLHDAAQLSPGAAIIPFKARLKDSPSQDFIDLARLIRAIQWMLTRINKNHEKENRKQHGPPLRVAGCLQ